MALIEKVRRFLIEAEHSKKKPLVVILGPTASGKTGFSVRLAQEVDGEVISADSRQIYREMNIGTDKIEKSICEKIPHHLIDIRDPDQAYSLADFQREALRMIDEIHRRGKIPLLVGGTGLYISAIVQNYQLPEAPPDPNLRKELEKELEKEGPEALRKMLCELDPLAASKIHPNNLRYLIRALEIVLTTKKPIAEQKKKRDCPYEVFQLGIDWPTEQLFERINARVNQQIEKGLLKETERLLLKYDKNSPSMTGLGYKQMIQYLEGGITLEEAVEILKKETRDYARRQRTWFKRDTSIYWVDGSEVDIEMNRAHQNIKTKETVMSKSPTQN